MISQLRTSILSKPPSNALAIESRSAPSMYGLNAYSTVSTSCAIASPAVPVPTSASKSLNDAVISYTSVVQCFPLNPNFNFALILTNPFKNTFPKLPPNAVMSVDTLKSTSSIEMEMNPSWISMTTSWIANVSILMLVAEANSVSPKRRTFCLMCWSSSLRSRANVSAIGVILWFDMVIVCLKGGECVGCVAVRYQREREGY
ncbi:hypothetical protein BCR33DRAFT_232132 [Rhizoclosmatium globosum]|uniref:Uncharacterized protein n=1 Tax=Rhizoclosmatium globosum TaxID=329046 RepID=A0A1Y2CA93_9FUNG|nr:hypothetical protein BCR33DRAFT_232132 [Rhizoclosmatium globosum]|eukprot:ORY43953.1 hypothetical protein BCR33DRAFT_232132 [Rhizoclosmatium globosum]